MHRHALLLALSLMSGAILQGAVARVPLTIFTDLGLTAQQIAAIDAGRPVAKVLPWGGPSEVYVFGAVHIAGSPETYLEAARDVGRLSGTPGYQGIGEIRDDATVAELSALAFDPDDVKALKTCREGACDVQLPTSGIQLFRDGMNWSRPDAADQANTLARQGVLQLVQAYRRGGNEALGEYRDKQHPARIADQFQTMIGRASALPDVLPEVRRYLSSTERRARRRRQLLLLGEGVVRPEAHDSRESCRHLSRPHAGPRLRRRGDQTAVRHALLPYRAGPVGVRRRRSGEHAARVLSADAQGLAAGRADRRQRRDPPEGRRGQDALVARTRTRLDQALRRTVRAPSLTWMPTCLTSHNIARRSHSVRSSGQCSSPRPRWSSTCLLIVRPFLNVIAWSSVLVITFHPVYQRLVRKTGRVSFSAFVCSVMVVVAFVIPLLFIMAVAIDQFLALGASLQQRFTCSRSVSRCGLENLRMRTTRAPWTATMIV